MLLIPLCQQNEQTTEAGSGIGRSIINQVIVISRSQTASHAIGGVNLSLREHIKILKMTADQGLRYDLHVSSLASHAGQRILALQRITNTPDPRVVLSLYKAQIRPYTEYSVLSWISGAASHMRKLNAVERRGMQMAENGNYLHLSEDVTSLEILRDVSALIICQKIQVHEALHLAQLSSLTHRQEGDKNCPGH